VKRVVQYEHGRKMSRKRKQSVKSAGKQSKEGKAKGSSTKAQ